MSRSFEDAKIQKIYDPNRCRWFLGKIWKENGIVYTWEDPTYEED